MNDISNIKCPYCGNTFKFNATYEIEDVRPDLRGKFCEVMSFICLHDNKELLLFMPWFEKEGQEPMAVITDISEVK